MQPAGTPEATPSGAVRRRGDAAPLGVCLVAGVLIATWPHLIWFARTGDPVYFVDNDDVFYVLQARPALEDGPLQGLRDPIDRQGRPSVLTRLPTVPGTTLAWSLGWDLARLNLAWRISAGLTMALGWYLAFRPYLAGPWLAAALTLVALADTGYGYGFQPMIRQAVILGRLALGQPGDLFDNPLHRQWRILNPSLTLPYLLVFVWALGRAREAPTRGRLLLAGATYGLLFYAYFYFWTAATVALVLAFVLDARHRRVYLHTGWIGAVVGGPAILGLFRRGNSVSPDWMHRTDFMLPVSRLGEIMIPKLATLVLVLVGVWAWRRRRDLLFPTTLAASAWMLSNHQVVTGIQLQNHHYQYVFTSLLWFVVVVLAATALGPGRRVPRRVAGAVLGLAAIFYASGLVIRAVDALRCRSAVRLNDTYARLKRQRAEPGASPLDRGATVAGDKGFGMVASVLDGVRMLGGYLVYISPYVSNEELDQRVALDAQLMGTDRPAFEAQQREMIAQGMGLGWGPATDDPRLAQEQLARRLAAFDAVGRRPDEFLDRYDVRYLVLPTGADPGVIAERWPVLQRLPTWDVRVRPAAPAETAGLQKAPSQTSSGKNR